MLGDADRFSSSATAPLQILVDSGSAVAAPVGDHLHFREDHSGFSVRRAVDQSNAIQRALCNGCARTLLDTCWAFERSPAHDRRVSGQRRDL